MSAKPEQDRFAKYQTIYREHPPPEPEPAPSSGYKAGAAKTRKTREDRFGKKGLSDDGMKKVKTQGQKVKAAAKGTK